MPAAPGLLGTRPPCLQPACLQTLWPHPPAHTRPALAPDPPACTGHAWQTLWPRPPCLHRACLADLVARPHQACWADFVAARLPAPGFCLADLVARPPARTRPCWADLVARPPACTGRAWQGPCGPPPTPACTRHAGPASDLGGPPALPAPGLIGQTLWHPPRLPPARTRPAGQTLWPARRPAQACWTDLVAHRLPAPGLLGRPLARPPACTGPTGQTLWPPPPCPHRASSADLVARPPAHTRPAWQTCGTPACPHQACLAGLVVPPACPHQALLGRPFGARPHARTRPAWQTCETPAPDCTGPAGQNLVGRGPTHLTATGFRLAPPGPCGPPTCPHPAYLGQTLWPAPTCPAPWAWLWQTTWPRPAPAHRTWACLADLWPAHLGPHRACLGRQLVARPPALPTPGPGLADRVERLPACPTGH
ncbi:basic proline-rich protein-like [Macrobrachium nipponense]|uniref:basic proline-rich protein-like n=1 Tax=Macrobrachium nipponense TaxID=159736 RepID=UPI0030C87E98